jgi:helix-turn-helix protein
VSSPREDVVWRAVVLELRRRRLECGIGSAELEARLGLTRGHISMLERLKRRPTGWNLSCWILALGGTLSVVWEDPPAPQAPSPRCGTVYRGPPVPPQP